MLTIVVALIFSILCSSIILIGYYNRFAQQKNNIAQRLIRNEESAINLVLSDTTFSVSKDEPFDLFSENKDSVKIIKGYWGIFRYAVITSFQNQFSRKKAFLFGSVLPDYMDACLYVADHQKPISLIGSTKLTGNAYLSKAGLRASYIGQRGYDNVNLIEGEIKLSEENLPTLNPQGLKYLLELISSSVDDTSQAKSNFRILSGSSYHQSFSDTALIYHYAGKLLVENVDMKGHIILFSNKEIEIDASAKLENVLLIAPAIRIRSNFIGTIQAIASDSLIVEPGCILNYPSAVILLKDTIENIQNVLRVSADCRVNGIIISYADTKDIYKSLIEIDNNTIVNGIIYTMGYLSLKGNVNGIVLTDYFIYKSPSTIYENHLVDILINRDKLSAYFAGPAIFSDSKSQQIVTWIN